MATTLTAAAGSRKLTARLRLRTGAAFELDVHFEAFTGFTTLFGPSGSGKSMVLACLAGLARPDAGEITLGERTLFSSERGIDLPPQQRRAGYVFQHLALFPHMTALENVMYGLSGRSRPEAQHSALSMMERFRIAHLATQRSGSLSGGERQRVALARTLVTEPDFLLLDEPLSALDCRLKSELLGDLNEWHRERGVPIIYVTHERDEVYALSQRVVVLDAGRMLGAGPPQDVLGIPSQLAVAQIAGFENIFDARVTAEHPELGTTTCEIASEVTLECPLVGRGAGGEFAPKVRIAIRAGDVLLATSKPDGLSARNVIRGRIARVERREGIMAVFVAADGVTFESHLTLGAVASLGISDGREIWLVIKTHSCHLLRE